MKSNETLTGKVFIPEQTEFETLVKTHGVACGQSINHSSLITEAFVGRSDGQIQVYEILIHVEWYAFRCRYVLITFKVEFDVGLVGA